MNATVAEMKTLDASCRIQFVDFSFMKLVQNDASQSVSIYANGIRTTVGVFYVTKTHVVHNRVTK